MKQIDALLIAYDCIEKVWIMEHAEAEKHGIGYVFSQRDRELSDAKKTLSKAIDFLKTI